MDGAEVLEAVKKIKPEIPMVMISGHGDMETALTRLEGRMKNDRRLQTESSHGRR
jgi:DNA-binding NtrC family response regulator